MIVFRTGGFAILIGTILLACPSFHQVEAADLLDLLTTVLEDFFRWGKYTVQGTLHVNGTIRLQNRTIIIPQNGVYWPSQLGNPDSPVFADVTTSVHIMLSLFYIATGIGNPSITIEAYRPCTNYSTATDIDYQLEFDRKNVTSYTRVYYNLKTNATWTRDDFQSMVDTLTTQMWDAKADPNKVLTSSSLLSMPFSWRQVVKHEIRSLKNSATHHHPPSTCWSIIIIAIIIISSLNYHHV